MARADLSSDPHGHFLRRTVVLVNNRAERNAPWPVEGLVEMLRSYGMWDHKFTAVRARMGSVGMAENVPCQLKVWVFTR